MDNQQQDPSWNPYDLYTDEHRAALETTAAIHESQDRIYSLAKSLFYDKQSLSEQDAIWLLHIAYNALGEVQNAVAYEEYRTRQRQELSQQLEELRKQPIVPCEPEPLPEWLTKPWGEVL
jgi:hypothetical protein